MMHLPPATNFSVMASRARQERGARQLHAARDVRPVPRRAAAVPAVVPPAHGRVRRGTGATGRRLGTTGAGGGQK